jgi:GLPGLI family protein
MKTIKTLALVALVMTTTVALAQKKLTEGKVVFAIAPPDDMDPQMAANMPTETIIYFKNDKLKTSMSTAMMKNENIIDNKTKKVIVCLDIMGSKFMIKDNLDSLKKKMTESKAPVVKVLDETKEIVGYKCKKAELTAENGDKSYVYFTNDIQCSNGSSTIKGIDGFLMEYDSKQNGVSLKMTAKSVSSEKVADAVFEAPDGYKETTMEDLKKTFGGGR